MTEPTELKVRGPYITLGQLMKFVGLASSGGEAKLFLSEGGITVNGEAEDRRGRKLRPGDIVKFPDDQTVNLT
jgi:ribosome-associated protein